MKNSQIYCVAPPKQRGKVVKLRRVNDVDAICENCGVDIPAHEVQQCERCGLDALGNCCIGDLDHDDPETGKLCGESGYDEEETSTTEA